MSLEASDIFYHNHREMTLKRDYLGMIPYSLESIKLLQNGLKTKYIEKRDKYISDDIINVKFKTKAKNADEMLDVLNNKLIHAKEDEYISELIEFKEKLEHHSSKSEKENSYWDSISVDDLRKRLYIDGFKINFTNPRTGNTKVIEYVAYKRSGAKSRTGQCLFIKKTLYKQMINWSRMDLPFKKGQVVDLASLLAYESLVGSSLEDTIYIDTNNILIVDDVESRFKQIANVVRKNKKTGFLDSFKENTEVVNSLFDGESLLESKYFINNNGMILLRNHMFKSAAFNCEIQKFLIDNCPNEIPYNEWKIYDMFGNEFYAKNIEMITTPSSLKALKFSHVLPSKTEKEMWDYWRIKVSDDGNLFGICKHEKESKIGSDENGNILQQTSYQMINCLPIKDSDIDELISTEKKYLESLKENDEFLINEMYKSRDITNSNESLCGIYKINKNIVATRPFKKFKKDFIYKKVTHAKKGKIKVKGDYCVLLGNPMEYLLHSIGKFDVEKSDVQELVGNEVYCPLHKENEELIGFRNPNTSPSNVLIMKNTYSNNIDTYFNLSANIVVVNAIRFSIQDILSGADYDSDTMLVSDDKKLVELGKRCFGKYDVCINNISGEKKKYKLSNSDMYDIDNQLSKSQQTIGRVVNLGQLCMSTYWDLVNKGINGDNVDELLKKVDVMTILSGIAIDMAKKFYDIDMESEINQVAKNEELTHRSKKPNFWIFVSQNKSTKNKVVEYDCPMDYLIRKMSELEPSTYTNTIHFDEIVNDFSTKNINISQLERVKNLISNYHTEVKRIQSSNEDTKREQLLNLEKETLYKFQKWKLKADTISLILKNTYLFDDEFLLKTLKLLYECHYEELTKVIKSV